MKKLLLAIFCLGIFGVSFAANPVYEVKKESVDVYVAHEANLLSEAIASVDLNLLTVKDFSEGSYIVEVVYINDYVAGIKTGIEDKEYLYVFKLSEKAKQNLNKNEKIQGVKVNRLEKLFNEADKSFDSTHRREMKFVFKNKLKTTSEAQRKLRFQFNC